LKIYNFMNLLNDGWGVQYDSEFFSPDVVDSSVNAQGQYVYTKFNNKSVSDLLEPDSLWQMRLGLQFEF